MRHASSLTSRKIFTRLREQELKTIKKLITRDTISLLHQSNLSQQCIEVSGLSLLIFQSDTLVAPHASEKKLDLTEGTSGEYSESINLKKLSSSFTVHQTSHGTSLIR